MIFDTYNLNTQASWYTDQPEGREVNVHCLQQLEKNTFFVGIGRIHHVFLGNCLGERDKNENSPKKKKHVLVM